MAGLNSYCLTTELTLRELATILSAVVNCIVLSLKRRRNEEISQELGQMITLVERICKCRLHWLGYVKRMNNNRLPIWVLYRRIEGTRSWRRQRKQWIDNVNEDVQGKDSNVPEASTLWKDHQKWTIFIQPRRQQPDGDPDGIVLFGLISLLFLQNEKKQYR